MDEESTSFMGWSINAMNRLEELEMYQEINVRIQTPKEEYLNGNDVLK